MMRIERSDALDPSTWRRRPSFVREGQCLLFDEVRRYLEEWEAREGEAPHMLNVLRGADCYYPLMRDVYRSLEPLRFPVSRLQHVTVRDAFLSILDEGMFRGSERTFPLQGRLTALRVSCWSVDIPAKDLGHARKKRLGKFLARLQEKGAKTGHLSREDLDGVRDMMANSPAVSRSSRYGNFRFSIRMKVLLQRYKAQHCGGQRPVLRVLGTEAFTQEIAHWVLIHSPQCHDFDHLPRVDPRGPFSRDGNLTWEPESMSDLFPWYICPQSGCLTRRAPQGGMYHSWLWSSPVFAFHLPGSTGLQVGRSWLLDSVQACESPSDRRILRHPLDSYVSEEGARAIICAAAQRCEDPPFV